MAEDVFHFTPLSRDEAELLKPMVEPLAANANDYAAQCRLADCMLAEGDVTGATAIYERVRGAAPDMVHAHAALLYISVRDNPTVRAAIDLPLRLRNIHGQQMLVWFAFPDTAQEHAEYPYFNRTLGKWAKVIKNKYPDLAILDVGANVAQSVAEVYAYAPTPCLSVECGPQNYALARYNSKRISADNEVVNALVGPEGLYGTFEYAKHFDMPGAKKPEWGFAAPVDAGAEGAVPTVSLNTIIARYPRWADSKLVKIDAEGWDWQIIQDCKGFWAAARPVIFFEHNFEYVKDRQAGHDQSLAAVKTLLDCGYTHFLVQDGRGHMITQINADHLARFHEINLHLYMLRDVYRGVNYFDVTAIHGDDADLAARLYQASLSPELQQIRRTV